MQIKITNYHLTYVGIALIEKMNNIKCWQGYREQNICMLLVRMSSTIVRKWYGGTMAENGMEDPQRTKNRAIISSSNSTTQYIKKLKIICQRDICIPVFPRVLFTIAKIENQPRYPSEDKWLKKMECIYT